MRRWLGAAFMVLASHAGAEDWIRLRAAAITDALWNRVVTYEDGTVQVFGLGGITYFRVGWPNEGRWRVRDDLYCSSWPSSTRSQNDWMCFVVDQFGPQVRFTAPDGQSFIGTLLAID